MRVPAAAGAASVDRARGGVEISRAVMDVGLQIGGLGPLVPGVDRDDAGSEQRRGAGDQLAEPALELQRRRADERQALALPAGVVVPGGHGGLDQRELGRGLGEAGGDDVVIGERVGLERLVEDFERVVNLRQALGQLVRREFDRRVEAERARIDVVEGLRHDEDRLFAVRLLEQAPPARERLRRLRDEAGAIDHQERPAVEPDIAGIAHVAGEIGAGGLSRWSHLGE